MGLNVHDQFPWSPSTSKRNLCFLNAPLQAIGSGAGRATDVPDYLLVSEQIAQVIVEHTNKKCVQEEKQANSYAHIFLEPNNRVMLLGACVKPQPLNYLLCTTKLRVFTTPPSSERAGNNVQVPAKLPKHTKHYVQRRMRGFRLAENQAFEGSANAL